METGLWIALGTVIGLTLALLYQSFMRRHPAKTGKREAGMFIMAVWALATGKFWMLDDVALINAFTAAWGLQTGSTFAFLAGVYGMQWYSHQHSHKHHGLEPVRHRRPRYRQEHDHNPMDDNQHPPPGRGYGA